MRPSNSFIVAWIVFGLVASSTGAKATPVTIQNGDFTDPTLTDGEYTVYTLSAGIPDWVTGTTHAGVQNFDGTGDYSGMPTASPNAAFDDGNPGNGPGSFYQDLTGDGDLDLVAAGTYTLTAYGGNRIDKQPWVGGSISLETSTGDVLGTQPLVKPAEGYFALTTLTVDVSAANADIGDQLRVVMTSNGNSTGFDDVALDFAAAPEPSTWAMMIAGLAFLGFRIRGRSILRS
jgi:hypothetical protein